MRSLILHAPSNAFVSLNHPFLCDALRIKLQDASRFAKKYRSIGLVKQDSWALGSHDGILIEQ
jgi:hypothetical protein